MKQRLARLKPYLRWLVLGGTLFFLALTFKQHWQEVGAIRLTSRGWGYLAIALIITLLAHCWSGWVWGWILRLFNQSVTGFWSLRVYLKTNLAKYLPGNVWHFYGRVWAAKAVGVPLGAATLSVVMEPLLMAAAALIIALLGSNESRGLQWLSLITVLVVVHPRTLNPLIHRLSHMKQTDPEPADMPTGINSFQLQRYPFVPLAGELGFVGLRGVGFLFTILALSTVSHTQILPTIGAFSFAWLLGLVVPGAPGGVGVFEVTALALLDNQFPIAIILSVVALYRLISLLAEVIGAGIVWLYDHRV